MEPKYLPPSLARTSKGSHRSVKRLRAGAIESRMAVAFREEKLALSLDGSAQSGESSSFRGKVGSFPGNVRWWQGAEASNDPSVPIIVHSHLRWDFVWQRPQQLLSRFAAQHPVLFVEEPIESASEPALEVSLTPEGVVRVVPMLPNADTLSVDAGCALVLPLLERAIHEHSLLAGRFASPVQWFYSPMTAPVYCGRFGAVVVVYDCMDELANFRFAPDDIAQREGYLLSKADVVFTGGYELYRSKSARHANTYLFGCGADAAHFGRARAPETVVPSDVAALSKPILGYFGVVDERLDYVLIEQLAKRFPAASIVMVGPLAKVQSADLPRAANIHWLGSRRYEDLPAIVKAFDVCLMPFAMNAATQFINPTKTLEYLAAGKPVVSSAVPDVVRQYTDIVDVAHSIDEFLDCVEKLVATVDPARIAAGIALARASTWDSTVGAMRGHILGSLARKRELPERFALATQPGVHLAQAQNQ